MRTVKVILTEPQARLVADLAWSLTMGNGENTTARMAARIALQTDDAIFKATGRHKFNDDWRREVRAIAGLR